MKGNEGYPLSARPTEEQPSSHRSPQFSPITQVFDQFGEASFEKEELRDLTKCSKERFKYEVFTLQMAKEVQDALTKEGLEEDNQDGPQKGHQVYRSGNALIPRNRVSVTWSTRTTNWGTKAR